MTNLTAPDSALDSPPMGTFDASGEYTPREIVLDDLGALSLDDAYSATMVDVQNGQLVEGTVVRVDKDEVLLDIGYKSEGWGPGRGNQGGRRCRLRHRHRGCQGRPDRRHRPSGLPARLPRRPAPGARPAALHGHHHRRQDHRARQEPQQRRALAPSLAGGDPEGAARGLPQQPASRRGPLRRGLERRQLRRLRRPGRHGRPHPRVRIVVEARRPSQFGRDRRRRDRGPGARHRPQPRAHQPVAQGHPAGPVARVRREPSGGRAGLRPGHEAGAVRLLRAGGRRHRGPGAHLGDVLPPRRPARAGRDAGRGALGQDHRPRPAAPTHQPLDQAGRRGRRRGRGVARSLRPRGLRRGGQLRGWRGRRRRVARGRVP